MIINERYIRDVDDDDVDDIKPYDGVGNNGTTECKMTIKILNANPGCQDMPSADTCHELYDNFKKYLLNILSDIDFIDDESDVSKTELYQIGYSMDDTRHDTVNEDAEPYMFFLYLCGFCLGFDITINTTNNKLASLDNSDFITIETYIKTFLRKHMKNRFNVKVELN